MKRTRLFSKIRQLALCLVLGGLLLPVLVGCEGEAVSSAPATSATFDAPSLPNSEINSPPVLLSSLLKDKTVERVEYFNYQISFTTVSTTDSAGISALLSVLDQITTQPYTKRCLCGAIETPTADCSVILRFDDGEYFRISLDKESKHLYYQYLSHSGQQHQRSHLKIAEEDWTKFENFVKTQHETLFPLMQIPSPEEYLPGTTVDSTIFNGNNKHNLNNEQAALIVERFKNILTDQPIVNQYPDFNSPYYQIDLRNSNDESTSITLYTTGMISVNLKLKNLSNFYCYQIEPILAQEYGLWLEGYAKGKEDSDLPTLNNLLNQSMYRIIFYDENPASYLLIDDKYAVQALNARLKKLNFTMLSEEIPENDLASDGMKIVFITSSNSKQIVLEFDSSGRINCRYTGSGGQPVLHEAQYTLSDEDMATLMGEIQNQKAIAADLPTLNEYFGEASLDLVSYSPTSGEYLSITQPKRKLMNISKHLQGISFTRVDDETEIKFDDYPKLYLEGDGHTLRLWLDVETGYIRVAWDPNTATFLPPQIYKISAEEAKGLVDLIEAQASE